VSYLACSNAASYFSFFYFFSIKSYTFSYFSIFFYFSLFPWSLDKSALESSAFSSKKSIKLLIFLFPSSVDFGAFLLGFLNYFDESSYSEATLTSVLKL